MIRLTATTLSGGSVSLDAVTDLTLEYSTATPAAQLTADITIDHPVEDLTKIELDIDGEKVFSGGVDYCTATFGKNGGTLSVEARSLGAKALDNEAKPDNLWGANLSAIFAKYLGGHGLSLVNKLPSAVVPQFVVSKGMSQWEVFRSFALRAYLCEPFVIGDTVYLDHKSLSAPALIFQQDSHQHLSYTLIEKTVKPYQLLSRIYLRDQFGEYSSSIKNPLADSFGVKRERYMIPTDEYTISGQIDARLRLEKSSGSVEHYTLKTPNLVFPKLGSTVEVIDSPFGSLHLVVEGARVVLGENGATTIITLKNIRYKSA